MNWREGGDRFDLLVGSGGNGITKVQSHFRSSAIGRYHKNGVGAVGMEMTHPDDRALVESTVAQALSGFRSYEINYRVLNDEGEYIYVGEIGWIERDEADEAQRVLCQITQFTDGRREPEETARQGREFRSLVDHYPDFVSRLDRELKHIYINPDSSATWPEGCRLPGTKGMGARAAARWAADI